MTRGSLSLATIVSSLLACAACTTGDAASPDFSGVVAPTQAADAAIVPFDAADGSTDAADASDASSDAYDAASFDAAACLGDAGGTITTHTFPWNFTVAGGAGQQVSVNRCDLVSWNNTDSVEHTVTSIAAVPPDASADAATDGSSDAAVEASAPFSFDTGIIKPSTTSKIVQFTEAGAFKYHCAIHSTLTGQITVH